MWPATFARYGKKGEAILGRQTRGCWPVLGWPAPLERQCWPFGRLFCRFSSQTLAGYEGGARSFEEPRKTPVAPKKRNFGRLWGRRFGCRLRGWRQSAAKRGGARKARGFRVFILTGCRYWSLAPQSKPPQTGLHSPSHISGSGGASWLWLMDANLPAVPSVCVADDYARPHVLQG